MRVLIILLAGAAGMAAQAAPELDGAAKLRQFERNLQNALRPKGGVVSLTMVQPPARVCAIPLLIPLQNVAPDASFQSNMPVIAPDAQKTFAARELVPPAPVCGEK
jgi:hypothetical protein